MTEGKLTRKEKILHELKAFASIALYLAACLSFLATIRSLVLIQQNINEFVHNYTVALVEAVAFGKVVLLTQNLRFLSAWENRSLAWSVGYKSVWMTLMVDIGAKIEAAIFRHVPEHTVHPLIYFFAHQAALLFIFAVLFTVRELDRALGPGKLLHLCFGPRKEGLPKTERE